MHKNVTVRLPIHNFPRMNIIEKELFLDSQLPPPPPPPTPPSYLRAQAISSNIYIFSADKTEEIRGMFSIGRGGGAGGRRRGRMREKKEGMYEGLGKVHGVGGKKRGSWKGNNYVGPGRCVEGEG